MMKQNIEKSRELEFAIFCIENIAAKLGVSAEKVYDALTEKSDILNDYIIPEYEILHTGPNGDAVVWKRRGFGSTGKGGV